MTESNMRSLYETKTRPNGKKESESFIFVRPWQPLLGHLPQPNLYSAAISQIRSLASRDAPLPVDAAEHRRAERG